MANVFLDNYSKAEDEANMLAKTGNFVQYGLPDMVVSAGTSFYNTGVALGNAFGLDGEQVDTEEAIDDILGEDAAEYYDTNQTLVDAGGLVLGSILPGTLAIKAGRAVAQGTLLTRTSKLATGIKETIHKSDRINAWQKSIASNNLVKLNNVQRAKLASQNFGQQAFEAGLFEAATLATMNQNPLLAQPDMTREELGYFEAIGENLDTAMFGMAFGAVLGGGIGYFSDSGALKNFIRDTRHGIVEFSRTFSSGSNAIVGDELTLKLEELFQLKQEQRYVGGLSEADKSSNIAKIEALDGSILNGFNDVIEMINKNSKGNNFGEVIVDSFKEAEKQFSNTVGPQLPGAFEKQLAQVIAGSERFSVLDPSDYSKTLQANVVPDSEVDIGSLLVKDYPEFMHDEVAGVVRLIDDIDNADVNGTILNKNYSDVDVFLQAAGHMKAQDISAIWNKRRVRVNYRNAQGQLLPDPTGAVNKKGKPKKFSNLLDIQDSLAKLAYQQDGNYRLNTDLYNEGWKQFKSIEADLRKSLAATQKVKPGEVVITKADYTDEFREAMDFAAKQSDVFNSLNSADNLLGLAYKTFNKAELSDDIVKQIDNFDGEYRLLYEWMNNNKLLKHKFGTTRAFMDTFTGKITNDVPVAKVSDLGQVVVKAKTVSAGKEDFVIGNFDPAKQSATEASAQFAWATSVYGSGKSLFKKKGFGLHESWKGKVGVTDLPILQAIAEGANRIDWQKGLSLVDGDTIKVVNSPEDLFQVIRDRKREIILELSQSKKPNVVTPKNAQTVQDAALDATTGKKPFASNQGYTLSEVAAYADVDEAYVHAVQRGRSDPWEKGEEFFTSNKLYSITDEGAESFKPNHIALDYNSQSFDMATDKRLIDNSDIMGRIQSVQRVNEDYATFIFGNDADLFPTTAIDRNGSSTVVDDITTVDDTTGFFRAFNADLLSGSSFVQSVGAAVRRKFINDQDAIQAALVTAATKVQNSKKAWQELSILEQSTLRSGKFTFLDPKKLESIRFGSSDDIMDVSKANPFERYMTGVNSETATQRIERILGIDADAMFNQVLTDVGITSLRRTIFTQEARRQIDAALRSTNIADDTAAQIEKSILEAASLGDEAVQQTMMDIRSNLLAEYRTQFDSVKLQLSNTQGTQGKLWFEIETDEVVEFLHEYQATNKKYLVDPYNQLNGAWGKPNLLDEEVIYPGRFNSTRFNHVAFVEHVNRDVDPWAAKGKGMLTGHNENALRAKVNKLKEKYGENVRITTSADQENFLKARQAYDADLALSDTAVDSGLRKEGLLFDLTPEPSPTVAEDMISSLVNQRSNVIKQTVKLKYGQEFATLEQLDTLYSRYNSFDRKGNTASTFRKHINQMMGITDVQDYKWWHTSQQVADEALSKAWHAVRGGITRARVTDDWESFSGLMDNYGLPKVYDKAGDWILANADAPKPTMQKFIAKSNGVFSTLMLRLDTAQAVVNAMASPIMLAPELKGLMHTINTIDPKRLERLNLVLTSPIDGAGKRMPTNNKIMMQATKNLFAKNESYMDDYVKHGIVGNDVHELRQAVDAATYVPDTKKWAANLEKAVDIAAKPVDFSERSVKFIAADSARQVLDVLQVPKDHPMYWSTIKTFTTRVTGNYNAAQRPALFQGWAGQAVGLFQTYQFNLFQQFMKHIEDGNGASKYMMGLQAATFGLQSVPGFQIMNQYIGEKTQGEKDFYSVATESFDNPVAEFLLYGGGSVATRPLLDGKGIDFFNRGDLTPRTPIIIPNSFEEVPVVSFYSKMISGLANTYDGISEGAPTGQVFLQALATNGVNRPLAGAAQLIMGERTTIGGTTMFKYPEMNYANVIAKAMGSRTLNEGIATNAFYRAKGYRAVRMQELNDLGQVVKAKIRSQDSLEPTDVNEFMREYASRGGKIESFQRWMLNNYANAEESNISRMYDNVNNTEGRYMQSVMGGRLEEFEEVQFTF